MNLYIFLRAVKPFTKEKTVEEKRREEKRREEKDEKILYT